MTYDKDGTILLGQIDDLEQDIGEIFRFLVPVMSPSAWLTANQEENAINGLALTKGGFTKGISSNYNSSFFLDFKTIFEYLNHFSQITIGFNNFRIDAKLNSSIYN